jgi:hypothetical protein
MFAVARTGWTLCATLEFSVPTTPTTSSSPASFVAAFLPTSGLASSSSASSSRVQPGIVLASLACLIARSTEFWMPRPMAARSPDRGAMTPILFSAEPVVTARAWPTRRRTARLGRARSPPSQGVYRFRDDDHGATGHLRRQGQEPAPAAVVLLPGRRPLCTRARPRWCAPARASSGPSSHRGRSAPAGVRVDQGVRPAVQRQVPRRQVLPLPGRDHGGGVPPRPGAAGGQAQGHPLLRPVRPRLGHPRDPRSRPARVSRAHLLVRRLQAGPVRSGRPCLLGLHRQVQRTVCGPGRRRAPPGDRRGLLRLHGGQTGRFVKRLDARDARGRRGARLRARGPPARRHRALERVLEKSAVVLPDGTDADVFPSPTTSWRLPCRSSTCAAGASGASAAGSPRRMPPTTPDLVEHLLQQVYGAEADEAVPREVLVPSCPDDAPALAALAVAAPGAGSDPGPPAGRQAQPDGDGDPQRRRRAWRGTRWPGPVTSPPAVRRSSRPPGRTGPGRTRRCASSASTSATCRAPRSSARWWSSRTACRASPSIAASSSAATRPAATDDTAAMHEVLTRRFRAAVGGRRGRRRLTQPGRHETGKRRPARFAYRPNLVVVDGGLPQVNAAQAALDDGGPDVAVVGLAKRLEEVWIPGEDHPLVLPRGPARASTCCSGSVTRRTGSPSPSTASAVQGHDRERGSTASPVWVRSRRKALLKAFGSVKRMRAATPATSWPRFPASGRAGGDHCGTVGLHADTVPAVNSRPERSSTKGTSRDPGRAA